VSGITAERRNILYNAFSVAAVPPQAHVLMQRGSRARFKDMDFKTCYTPRVTCPRDALRDVSKPPAHSMQALAKEVWPCVS